MYVGAIHTVSDPQRFWGTQLQMPEGVTLHSALPNEDGTRAVCIWEAPSVGTVQQLVDGAAGEISTNEFFAINQQNAQGLPS